MSLAARRGLGRPLSVATKDSSKIIAIQRRIEKLTQPFNSMYTQKDTIHDGGEQCRIFKYERKEDKVIFVVKVQAKRRIRGANTAIFRRMTERMMNLPESEHVVKVFACYEDDQYFYTILEECQGGDLFDFFRLLMSDDIADDVLEREVRVVMREMILSLNYLHKQGLVHKDVKLENLVFKQAGGAQMAQGGRSPKKPVAGEPQSPKMLKLIDFDFTDEWEPGSPKSKAVVGTDGYIAPEAYVGDPCPKSDIFSAGVVMYVLIAGRFPYSDDIFDDGPNENYVGSPKMAEIYEKLRRASPKIRFGSAWKQLPEAAEFCKALIAFELNDRLDADQALAHPWILAGGTPAA